MKEEFLHYIWQNKLFTQKKYTADTGEEIEIIDTGIPNFDAGPDFFNGKIKTGSTIWAGNIEIHIKSSDWKNHQHDHDKAYDNVILHVVAFADGPCVNSNGLNIATIKIEYPPHIFQNYSELQTTRKTIPCESRIPEIDPMLISMWIEYLSIERVQKKTNYIHETLKQNKNNWEESFYQILARSYGFGVNSDPFEQLARSIPLKTLTKHKSNITEIEALLFGQSGILELNEKKGDYTDELFEIYGHLKNKYKLKPIDGFTWKFLRLRPVNFPTIRIAQFSNLLYKTSNVFSQIIEAESSLELTTLLETSTTPYWNNHYHFGKKSDKKIKTMGTESVKSIIINSIVPFLYLYGEHMGKEYLKTRALDFLNDLQPEKNSVIKTWEAIGIGATNAFETQALIQLKKEYCDSKKCLQCSIGNMIIKKR